MVDQKLTVSQFQCGIRCMGVARPRLAQTSAAATANNPPSSQVAAAPAFSVHLPILTPAMLAPSATQIAANDAPTRKSRSPARRAYEGPSVENPTPI